MALLPPRPLRLDARALAARRWKKVSLAILVAGLGAGFAVGAGFCTRELLAERALWERGVEGHVQRLSGKVLETQKLGLTFIYDYRVDVAWTDAQGTPHEGKTSFERMFKGVPRSEIPALRYDPQRPDRIVLSWAAQGGLPRHGMAILCALLGVLMLLGTVAMVRSERRRMEALRICAEDGEEMECRVEKTWEHKGVYFVQYRLADDGRLRKYEGERPLMFLRNGVPHVLALRSPRAPDAPYLPEADLRLFDLSEADRARIREALRASA
ncbi:MAG TPA: hypothetical protein VEP66_05110 [Myxococcales bacterium]|nr:hypothetical protein [Myxococcales bacterium]